MDDIILKGTHGTYRFNPAKPENLVGEGGMGRVFKGEEEGSNRKVAVKVLFKELTGNANNVERFKIEATVKITHPNLIEMLDFIEYDGRYHIISEFLEGEVLSDKIDRLKKEGEVMGVKRAKEIILQIANGLEELHKNHIIHRDVKPSNVMVLNDRTIKLFDYGVIKKNDDVLSKLTRAGAFIGSYQYASPEQIRNIDKAAINESTDVYSLGVTLYELITGEVPFDGSSEYEIMEKHTKEKIPKHPFINKDYYALIEKATAKNQNQRYKTVSEFKTALENLESQKAGRKRKRGVKRIIGIAAIVIGIIFVGLVGLAIYQGKNDYDYFASLAEAHYNNGDYRQATYLYGQAAAGIWKPEEAQRRKQTAELLDSAVTDFRNAKYSDAYEKFKAAAEAGSAPAYYYLGELTFEATGTARDIKLAWEYASEAWSRGFKLAGWRIGTEYTAGQYVDANPQKAQEIFNECIDEVRRLADLGDPEGLIALGRMFYNGFGVNQDTKSALSYFTKAAEKGYALAYAEVGTVYYLDALPKNFGQAKAWLKKSADMGEPRAQVLLANIYISEAGLMGLQGVRLLRQAAEQNHPEALLILSGLYYSGRFVPQNNEKAFEYTQKAINYDRNHIVANQNLAVFYKEGIGVPRNYRLAKDYFLRVTELDPTLTDELLEIALLYQKGGFELEKDYNKFIEYCTLAEQRGNPTATEILARYQDKSQQGNLIPIIR